MHHFVGLPIAHLHPASPHTPLPPLANPPQAALGRRLEQVAPKSRTAADPSLAAAMAEAEQLLAEVQGLP